jgi:fatty acid desaturase
MPAENRQEDVVALKRLAPLVKDLHRPRALIYWFDLAACLALISISLQISRPFPGRVADGSILALLGLLVAGLALYRASYFNHELAHQSRQLPGFELAWNLTIGIPLLIPSYLYTDHLNHHSIKGFGTDTDIEYFAPRLRGLRGAVVLIAACSVLPFVYIVRFAVVTPLAWVSPAIRRWVDINASGLGIFGLSRRAPPTAAELPAWRLQEAACFVYLCATGVLILFGILPISWVMQFYVVMGVLLFFHAIRIMVGHRYDSNGEPQSRVEQVLDSFNFTRNRVVTSILAPLGFRLHALHHLFPKIPYHNMPEAHRRICAALPKNSFYHAAESHSYVREVVRFLTRSDSKAAAAVRAGGAPAAPLSTVTSES